MRTKLVAFGSVPIRLLSVLVMWGMISTGVHAQLAHRYSFTANANDSVGTAHGNVVDAGTTANSSFTGGALDFSANTGETSNAITEGAYLNLPNFTVSSAATAGMNGAVAFEWWYTLSESRTWQRVGDFGNSNTGEDTSGSGSATDYLSIVATSGRGNIVDMTNHTNTGFEPAIGQGGTALLGTPYHVMAVYNHNDTLAFTPQGSNGTMTLYVNGARIGTAGIHPDIDIRTMDDVNNWLGRSQWGDPLFDGSYDEFRIYNTAPSAAYVTASFNAGPNALAAFTPWVEEFDLEFTVNRDTGTFSLSNSAAGSINVAGISISTPSGSIDGTKWLSVTNNYDSDNGGEFDTDNSWSITANTATQLTEVEVVGDGGQLGSGGTEQSIQLGDTGAWRLSRYEDLVVTVDRLMPDFSIQVLPVRVNYVGGLGAAAARTDLNFDGDIDADDWVIFASNHFETYTGMTRAQSAVFGDMDGDLDNDYGDFLLFQSDFDAANGLGALSAVIANVPEPSSAFLLLFGSCAVAFKRRKSLQRGDFSMNQNRSSLPGAIKALAVAVVGVVLGVSQADAAIVGTAGGTFIANDPNVVATFPYALQGGGNALVVGTYIDNTHTVSNVTYAGASPVQTVIDQRVQLHYFSNPAAAGDVSFNFTLASLNNPNSAYFIYEVANVDTSAGFNTGAGGSITTTVDNRLILSFIGLNNDDGDLLAPAAGSLLTLSGVANANGAIGGASLGAGYASTAVSGVAGLKQIGWQGNDLGFFQGQSSIALSIVPEPSSACLLLIGSCAVVFNRRKRVQRGDLCMNQNRSSLSCLIKTLAVAAIGIVLCGSRTEAQIVGTFNFSQVITTTPETLSGSLTIPYTLQNNGSNALVIGTYLDNTHTLSNMLYAGAAPQTVVTDQRMNLYYFENPATTGNFTFNYTVASSNNPNFGLAAFELFGVDLNGVVDTGVGAAITTTVDNQFIVSMAGLNNDAGAGLIPAAGSLVQVRTVTNANGAIGGGAVGAGYVDARDSGVAGVKQVGFAGNGGGFFQGQASIGLRADPLLVDLTLVVNKTTGQASIRNDSDSVMSFDYYRIESPGNALDLAGWNSLDDQNIGSLPADFNGNGSVGGTDLPVWQAAYGTDATGDADGDGDSDGRDFLLWQRSFGQSPTVVQSWIEAGGSTTAAIGELLLNGATSLGPGQSISLGAAYNEAIFGANDGDLVFNVSLGDSAQLQEGAVEYVTGAIMAVPEPTSFVMCSLGLASLMWRRR
jgi:hypothetical protein